MATLSKHEQAAEWIEKLHDLTPQEKEAFQSWLSASSENKAAFEELYSLYRSDELTAALYENQYEKQHSNQYKTSSERNASVSHITDPRTRKHTTTTSSSFFGMWPVALAASVVFIVAFQFFPITNEQVSPAQSSATHIASTAGIQNTALSDGSRITLAPNSELTFKASNSARIAQLKGHAYFDIEHDPSRPFEIEVGSISVSVLGTEFDIESVGKSIRLFVTEGLVSVSSEENTALSYQVEKGQAIEFDGHTVTQITAPYIHWEDGWLVADDMSVEDIIITLQKFIPKIITLQDPKLKSKKLTGRFNLSKPVESLGIVAKLLNLEVEESNNVYQLVAKSPK